MAGRSLDEVEAKYLATRYACEALRIKLRRSGAREKAGRLKEAMSLLCAELRRVLAAEGRSRVSTVFPSELLGRSLEELEAECRRSAERLSREEGSRAASLILELLGS